MGKKQHRWISAEMNNKTFIDYQTRLKELALNVFKWDNLPPTIDERFLELTLYEKGYALYFNDDVIGNLALTCTIGGELDVYRVPILRQAFATNGYNKYCNSSDSVLMFNNYLRTPTCLTIDLFALRLYEIERTIDVNVKAQKTPIMILADEQQKLTMKNLYMQYDGNEPFIFGDKNLGINDVKAINTSSPFLSDKLQVLKHQIINEAYTFIGIENSNADKKERLVSDEVNSNYGAVEGYRNVQLNARKQACKQINAMFGTNISVRFNSDVDTTVNAPQIGASRETFTEEGDTSG